MHRDDVYERDQYIDKLETELHQKRMALESKEEEIGKLRTTIELKEQNKTKTLEKICQTKVTRMMNRKHQKSN